MRVLKPFSSRFFKTFKICFFIILITLFIVIVTQNVGTVEIHILWWTLMKMPLIVLVFVIFALGFLTGLLLTPLIFTRFVARKEKKAIQQHEKTLKKQYKKIEKENNKKIKDQNK